MHVDELARRGKNKATLPFKIVEMLAIQAFGVLK
jgi:hypothetical protein